MFAALLNKVFKKGTLTIIWPDGRAGTYGSGLPKAAIRVHGRGTLLAIALRPDLAFGEAYMDGRVTVEEGTIADVLELALSNVPPDRSAAAHAHVGAPDLAVQSAGAVAEECRASLRSLACAVRSFPRC